MSGSSGKSVKIFIAFKHGGEDEIISDTLKQKLSERGIETLRLKDDRPVAGTTISGVIDEKVSQAVGLVTLWSPRAARSKWVPVERGTAKKKAVHECLIRWPRVPLPPDWPKHLAEPDRVYVPLKGVNLGPPKDWGNFPLYPRFIDKEFNELVDEVERFALHWAKLLGIPTPPKSRIVYGLVDPNHPR